jgi:hypothetical protein
MVALPTEVRRSGKSVRSAFGKVFQAMVKALETNMGESGGPAHKKAQAVAALCIGGMVIARAIDDGRVADELREACMEVALDMGRWRKRRSRSL